jgi:hypothetical protein
MSWGFAAKVFMIRLGEKRRGFYGTLASASNPCCDKKKRNPQVALNPPMEEGGDDNVAKAQGGGEAPATERIMPQALVQCNMNTLCPDHCFTCQNISL